MTTDASSDRPSALAPIDRRTWQLCWVIVLGAFASGLDASVVNLGLTEIGRDLGSTLSTTQWVANAYLLALAVSLPLGGWLARRYGSGRVWLAALAGFTLTSVLCALAPNAELLIAARVAQGLSGGVLIPVGQTILGQAVGPQRLGRVMGTLGIAVSAAPAIGPFAAGLILHTLDWPWLFLINLPVGVAGLILGRRLIPPGRAQPAKRPHLMSILLVTAGLPMIVFALTLWSDEGRVTTLSATLAGLGCVALAAFVAVCRRVAHPLLDLDLYRYQAFRAGSIAALASGGLVFGSGIVTTLYFQIGRDQSPLHAGISLLGVAGATTLAAPLAGRWVDRHGPAPVALTGAILAVATTIPMVALPVTAPLAVVQPILIAYGVAIPLAAMPAGVAAYRAVRRDQLPDAITQVNILQRVGGALSGAMCAVLIASRLDNPTNAFRVAYLALLVGAIVACVAAGLIYRATRTD